MVLQACGDCVECLCRSETVGQVVIYAGGLRERALVMCMSGLGAFCSRAPALALLALVSHCASSRLAGVIWRLSHTRHARHGSQGGVGSQAWSAEWQHSGSKTGAPC